MIRRLWCRLTHRGLVVDDGPRARWCIRCGDAR